MVSRKHLFFGIPLLAVGWIALCAHGQSVTTKPTNAATTVSKRPELSPQQKHRNELFSALLKRRRAACAEHSPNDSASKLLAKVSSGEVKLDNSNLRSLTTSVLAALDVPISSQLLVFSGSASQGRNVNPKNPRAIYFNDEVYVGMVPGGLLEMIGVDPEIGGVLYTFRNVGTGRAPSTTGGTECARCHSRSEAGYAMGFFVRSVIPDEGGSLVVADSLGYEDMIAR